MWCSDLGMFRQMSELVSVCKAVGIESGIENAHQKLGMITTMGTVNKSTTNTDI